MTSPYIKAFVYSVLLKILLCLVGQLKKNKILQRGGASLETHHALWTEEANRLNPAAAVSPPSCHETVKRSDYLTQTIIVLEKNHQCYSLAQFCRVTEFFSPVETSIALFFTRNAKIVASMGKILRFALSSNKAQVGE